MDESIEAENIGKHIEGKTVQLVNASADRFGFSAVIIFTDGTKLSITTDTVHDITIGELKTVATDQPRCGECQCQ